MEHRPTLPRGGVSAIGYVLLAAAVALSAWQAQLNRDASAAHWIVGLVAAGAIGVATLLGWRRQRETARGWVAGTAEALRTWRSQQDSAVLSAVVWTVLIAGVVGWDLVSFVVQSPKLPTLSYFIGHITRYRFGRGALFALWLGVGSYLVAAWRTEAPR